MRGGHRILPRYSAAVLWRRSTISILDMKRMLSKMDRSPTLEDRNSHVRFGSKADMCDANRNVRFGPKADIYLTEILGLLHPRLAQAFDEFRHPAGVQGDVLFDPRNRIFRMQFLQ